MSRAWPLQTSASAVPTLLSIWLTSPNMQIKPPPGTAVQRRLTFSEFSPLPVVKVYLFKALPATRSGLLS